MQEREEQNDCSMRVVPREIEWIVPSRSIVTKYSGTGRFCVSNEQCRRRPGSVSVISEGYVNRHFRVAFYAANAASARHFVSSVHCVCNPVPGQQIQEEMKHGIYDRC